ncbi:MAG: hypothetical protein IJO03_05665 [Clostridia bacterium]|nr:hypothetical protein [Clostridia bacterium]
MKKIISIFSVIITTIFILCSCNATADEKISTTNTTTPKTTNTTYTTTTKKSTYTYNYTTSKSKDKYSSLTNSEKKAICEYIEGRYEYYDNINGGYSGDKYSDRIMQEAATRYGLTTTQIEIIWMNMYSY